MVEYDWFDNMVNAYPDIKEDETPLGGPIVEFTKKLKQSLKVQKLRLSYIKRLKKGGFTSFKTKFISNAELEYNLE